MTAGFVVTHRPRGQFLQASYTYLISLMWLEDVIASSTS